MDEGEERQRRQLRELQGQVTDRFPARPVRAATDPTAAFSKVALYLQPDHASGDLSKGNTVTCVFRDGENGYTRSSTPAQCRVLKSN